MPPPGSRLHFDFSVVQLDDAEDHRQADAAALLLGREIQVEDARQIIGGDADAGVFDVDGDPAPRGAATADSKRVALGIACSALIARLRTA